MRKQLILLALLLCTAFSASARVNVSIGIHVPVYPRLVQVPSYPVYYAPDLNSNYFFYDGQYWVYQDDGWYSSEWYDGPWDYVEPEFVPYFILRVPVRYYRLPPRYFSGWQFDAPPLWHVHWGAHWASRHRGWDHWDRRYVPRPAPLPVYQRNYSGHRYPGREQQHAVHTRNYNYRPHEQNVRTRYEGQRNEGPRRDRNERRYDGRQESERQRYDRSDSARQFSERSAPRETRQFDHRQFDRRGNDDRRNETRRNDDRRNDNRRNDDAPRQFTASPERQLMPAPQAEQRERRVIQNRDFQTDNRQARERPSRMDQRQQWDGQRQFSQRQSASAPQQREQREFAAPRSQEGNDRGRGNGQERHERRDHDRGGRGDRGRDRT